METFTMSRKEVLRAGLVRAALAGKITNAEGAGALHLTVRQFKRLKARVRTEGVAGLPHRARGRPGRRHLGAGPPNTAAGGTARPRSGNWPSSTAAPSRGSKSAAR